MSRCPPRSGRWPPTTPTRSPPRPPKARTGCSAGRWAAPSHTPSPPNWSAEERGWNSSRCSTPTPVADAAGEPPAEATIIAHNLRAIGFDFQESELTDETFPIERYRAFLARENKVMARFEEHEILAMKDVYVNNTRLMWSHTPARFSGDLLFVTAERDRGALARERGHQAWAAYVGGEIVNHDVDSDHEGLMTRPGPLAHVGRVLAGRLAELDDAAREASLTSSRRTAVDAQRRVDA